MAESLPIGVLHLDVKHRRIEENRAALAALAEEAGQRGARLIVAPELATSGYSFEGRGDAAAIVEEVNGETLARLAPVAKKHGAFICTGFAERDPATDIYYNSALVVGPDGLIAGRHRKVASERRWARPGGPSHTGVVETPWGRLGILICADSYFGLLPRALALRGVDLLLVLANWPPAGLDPRKVWRARALENGFGVVACNRTGMDRIMDCRACRSYAVTSRGEVLLDEANETSAVWRVDYPLSDGGRLASGPRETVLAARRPEEFSALYLDVNNLEDFSGLWGLPAGGPLDVRCLVPASGEEVWGELKAVAAQGNGDPTLLILPKGVTLPRNRLLELLTAHSTPLAIAAETADGTGSAPSYDFLSASGRVSLASGQSTVMADFPPARIALARPDALKHPEMAVSLSKQGCDVVVTAVELLRDDDRLVLGAKCLERVVIAAAAPDGAMVCEPPVGHAPWREETLHGPGVCAMRIDTTPLRIKRFQDRVDMEALLRR